MGNIRIVLNRKIYTVKQKGHYKCNAYKNLAIDVNIFEPLQFHYLQIFRKYFHCWMLYCTGCHTNGMNC